MFYSTVLCFISTVLPSYSIHRSTLLSCFHDARESHLLRVARLELCLSVTKTCVTVQTDLTKPKRSTLTFMNFERFVLLKNNKPTLQYLKILDEEEEEALA